MILLVHSRNVGRRTSAHHVQVEIGHDRVARHGGVVGKPLRAPQSLLLTGLPDEEQRPHGLHRTLRKRLGDLENRHRAGAVVIGTIADGVGTCGVDPAQRILDGIDARPLFGSRRRGPARVGALYPRHHVVGLDRIVLHRWRTVRHADVIGMCAEHDVFVPKLRVGAGQDGDDAARWLRHVLDPDVDGHVPALVASNGACNRLAQHRCCYRRRNSDREWRRAARTTAAATTGRIGQCRIRRRPCCAPIVLHGVIEHELQPRPVDHRAHDDDGCCSRKRGSGCTTTSSAKAAKAAEAAATTAGRSLHDDNPAAHGVGIERVDGVAECAAEYRVSGNLAVRRDACGAEVHVGMVARSAGADGRRWSHDARDDRHVLEEGAVVTRWAKAKASHLPLDIRRGADRVGGSRLAAAHRIRGVDVEPRHEVACRDGGHRCASRPGERHRGAGRGGRAGLLGGERHCAACQRERGHGQAVVQDVDHRGLGTRIVGRRQGAVIGISVLRTARENAGTASQST